MKRALLIGVALLLTLVLAGGAWVAGSEAGLRWLFVRLTPAAPGGELTADSLRGRLIGPIEIRGLRYRSPTLDIDVGTLSLDWSPWALARARLHITHVDAGAFTLTLRPAATPKKSTGLPTLRLPLAILVDAARLDGFRLARAGRDAETLVDALELTAETRDGRLHIDRLVVRGPRYTLDATGQLAPRPPYALDLETRWTLDWPGYRRIAAAGRLGGDLRRLTVRQTLSAPAAVTVEGELRDVTGKPRWQASARSPGIALRAIRADWPDLALSGELQGEGDFAGFIADADLRGRHPDFDSLDARARAGYRERAWTVESLTLTAPDSDFRIAAQGRWDTGATRQPIEAQLHWQQLRWPPRRQDGIRSPNGELRLMGTPDDYTLTLAGSLAWADQMLADIAASGHGDRTGVVLDTVTARGLDGEARADGRVHWRPQLDWQARLTAHGIDPATLAPGWPGRIALDATIDGGVRDGRLALGVAIARLHGTLRGQAVELRGRLERSGERYRLSGLEATSNSARLTAQGTVGESWALTGELTGLELSDWFYPSSGALRATAALSGARAAPRVVADAAAESLTIGTHRADRLALRADVDLSDAHESSVLVDAGGLTVFGQNFGELQGRLHGRTGAHRVELVAGESGDGLHVSAGGGYRQGSWTGTLERADFDPRDLGPWHLEAPLPLAIGAAAWAYGPGCWIGGTGRLCSDGEGRRGRGGRLALTAERLPTAFLQPLLGPDTRFAGSLDADLTARVDPGGALNARLAVSAGAGSLSYVTPGGARVTLEHDGGKLNASAADRRVDLNGFWVFALDGYADVELSAPFAPFERVDVEGQPLRGRVNAVLLDLSPLPALFPQLADTAGTLRVDLGLAGSRGEPRLTGRVSVEAAGLDIPRLGIRPGGIAISARSDDGRRFTLSGHAESGGGRLDIDGEAQLGTRPAWTARVALTGHEFQLVRIPEANLEVSPDLRVDFAPGRIDARGQIYVPRGRLAPKDLTQAATSSSDVVMVGEAGVNGAAHWAISSEIRLALGDAVRFEGFNVRATITGDVTAVDRPQRPTTGRGELRVTEGSYQVYGQPLKIERGRLIFAGGPITDPGLDMRAVREIGEVTAGVQARGTLTAPVLTVFSEPAMNQTDALSYLLLGRPAAQAGSADATQLYQAASSLGLVGGEFLAQRIGTTFGIEEVRIEPGTVEQETTLMLGTHLSPKLYISYGIGLFEPVNTLRVRYRIGRYWTIETESGAQQGADLLYTIER
ncbi:MAG TPA: translocation/assembly module TamB domain-containing protein [Acidiferrobacterales bacterium]